MIFNILILFFAAMTGGLATRFLVYKPKNLQLPLIFAGSFLFGLTVIHLLPEIFEFSIDDFRIGIWILVGFFFQQILDRFTTGVEHGHYHKGSKINDKIGLISALIIHSILEGSLLANDSPIHQHHTAYSLLVGILLHKIPAAFVLMTILREGNTSSRTQYFFLFLFSLSSPLGILLSSYFVLLSTEYFVILYALVSGIFLHISTTIFVEANPEHRFGWRRLLVGAVGATFAIMAEYIM